MENDKKVASNDSPLEYHLQKYLLLLATLVAAVTYAAGFNPPGGAWQDSSQGYLAGEPIIRTTDYHRYLIFYYCNATAFAASIVLIILILILAIIHEKKRLWILVLPLRLVMVLDLLSLMGAYVAGTGRDMATWVLVTVIFVSVLFHMLVASWFHRKPHKEDSVNVVKRRHRKVLMLLATFVTSITYMSGLSAPGGFWDSSQKGHRAGDPILQEHHSRRLRMFFFFNTVAFAASLLIIMLLLDRKMRKGGLVRCRILYSYITVALVGLGGAYAVGSCREMSISIYVVGMVGAVLVFICIQVIIHYYLQEPSDRSRQTGLENSANESNSASQGGRQSDDASDKSDGLEKAHSLVILLATLVATVTYQAALVPPGGIWQDDQDGHKAGDPILLSTNPKRYKVFFYCNSTAFVASLVIVILVRYKSLLKHHALERAIILVLFGLMGAYAAGSCREVSTSIYVIALAGAVLVYVVIHLVFFFVPEDYMKQGDDDKVVHKRRKRLLLFAVLGTTLTYQAGLTPPSGFYVQDHEFGWRAGDPILFHNYPRRYNAFYYCNSVSFMSSIALIILLANSNLYKPAIRSYALSVCTAAGLLGLMGAYAAGSTQHLKTSFYIFGLVALVLSLVLILLVIYTREVKAKAGTEMSKKSEDQKEEAKQHARRKYLMLLGVLAASVTYQAGLNPPGGVWQQNSNGHAAGDPVMQDNRKRHYIAFFCSNSISFAASIVVIILLLLRSLQKYKLWLNVMNITIVLDLISLLVAYASGSTIEWETSGHIIALIVPAALVLVAIYMLPSFKPESSDPPMSSSAIVWLHGQKLEDLTPNLFASVPTRRDIQGGFSVITLSEYLNLWNLLVEVELQENVQDTHRWRLTSSGQYLSKSAYINLFQGSIVFEAWERLWKSWAPNKCKFFMWLVLHNRCWTADRLARRNLPHPAACPLCDQQEETIATATHLPTTPLSNKRLNKAKVIKNPDVGKVELLWKLRKYLVLLAILAAAITYQAGLASPGGFWQDNQNGHTAGDIVLRVSYPRRYQVFFYCNTTAFAASLFVLILLLVRELSHNVVWLRALQFSMVLGLLRLMGAYAAGSYREVSTLVYIWVLLVGIFAYMTLHVIFFRHLAPKWLRDIFLSIRRLWKEELERNRSFLLVLATLAATVTYVTGLSPPGGFWPDDNKAQYLAGDPVLRYHHPRRFKAFLVCNATSFAGSLVIIIMLLSNTAVDHVVKSNALRLCVLVSLFWLMGAYGAESCREVRTSIYVFSLVGAAFIYLFLQWIQPIVTKPECVEKAIEWMRGKKNAVLQKLCYFIERTGISNNDRHTTMSVPSTEYASSISLSSISGDTKDDLKKLCTYLLFLGILASTITYQAGLNPPGGFWADSVDGHIAGDPILHSMHPRHYKAFFYCNATAFVASLVIITLLQSKLIIVGAMKRHILQTAMTLDLFGHMGAYAAGSSRKTNYAIDSDDEGKDLEKQRKFLMLLAILAASVTYQAGLSPPGGFWTDNTGGHQAGDPKFLDEFPLRYKIFFYFNATAFVASLAVIMLLVSKRLCQKGLQSFALRACVLVGLISLLGAFAAGSCRKVSTSVYVILVVIAVSIYVMLQVLVLTFAKDKVNDFLERMFGIRPLDCKHTSINHDRSIRVRKRTEHKWRKDLMLIGTLAVTVTYQAALLPPGGIWPDDQVGHFAGDPILHDPTQHVISVHGIDDHGHPLVEQYNKQVQEIAPCHEDSNGIGLDRSAGVGDICVHFCPRIAVFIYILIHVLLSFDSMAMLVKKKGEKWMPSLKKIWSFIETEPSNHYLRVQVEDLGNKSHKGGINKFYKKNKKFYKKKKKFCQKKDMFYTHQTV
ncbi:hypothetical protein U9M48_028839 [Paspalum notatum var. saurae]|uniref:Embryogenesis transmembrane protein n=1 Tax=Paspalum notatum var. saurae TaxID=547442 RepID=A0AAQ3TW94_PASNO